MLRRGRLGRVVLALLVLLVTAYLVWDRIEARGLAHDIAAIAVRGEPVHFGEGYLQPRTPEQREASSLYAQAAALAQEHGAEDNHRASRLDLDKPGGPELNLPDIVAAYRADAPPLQLLDRATPLDFGGFQEEDRGQPGYELPMVALGSLACLRADLAAIRGDGGAAVAALVPSVRLQRTLNWTWYRSQHAGRLLGSFRILFRHTQPSDASLVTLQRAFETWPDEDGALRTVLQERARLIDVAGSGMRQILPPLVRFLFHPLAIRGVRRGIASFEPSIAIARQPWPARWRAVAAIEASGRLSPRGRPGLLTRLLDPFPMWFAGLGLTESARELAARRTAVAVIAVERFRRAHAGAPPSSLDALAPAFIPRVPQDPFSGEPLVYRNEADGYVIYSVDSNRRDDEGALYGHGAAVAKFVGPQSPRDLGIRVPYRPAGDWRDSGRTRN